MITTNINSAPNLIIYKIVVKMEDNHATRKIVVINFGPDIAANTRIIDVLPKELKLVSYSATNGTFDPTIGVWTIDDIYSNDCYRYWRDYK